MKVVLMLVVFTLLSSANQVIAGPNPPPCLFSPGWADVNACGSQAMSCMTVGMSMIPTGQCLDTVTFPPTSLVKTQVTEKRWYDCNGDYVADCQFLRFFAY